MIKEFERKYKMRICCHCKKYTKWANNKNNCAYCLIKKRKSYNKEKAQEKYKKKLKKEGKPLTYKQNRK